MQKYHSDTTKTKTNMNSYESPQMQADHGHSAKPLHLWSHIIYPAIFSAYLSCFPLDSTKIVLLHSSIFSLLLVEDDNMT